MDESLLRIFHCEGCGSAFNSTDKVPLLLTCGHTLCRFCVIHWHCACPVDSLRDMRELRDIPISSQHFAAVLHVEPGCYWHIDQPAGWYCEENLVSACQECTEKYQDWEWKSLSRVDLIQLISDGITSLCSDNEFTDYVYASNCDLKRRVRERKSATGREKQALYFHLLSYRDQLDYSIEAPKRWQYGYCHPTDNGEFVLKRFQRMLPNKYTFDMEQVQCWNVHSPDQVEAVSFTVSKDCQLWGVWVGKECVPTPATQIETIHLILGLETGGNEGWTFAENVRYDLASHESTQEIRLSAFIPLVPSTFYTLKVKYTGKAVYFGDPLSRTDIIRGPEGLEVCFCTATYTNGDKAQGRNERSGPIVGLTVGVERDVSIGR